MKRGRILKGLLFSAALAFTVITAGKINAKAATAINVNQEYNLKVPAKTGLIVTFTNPGNCTIQVEAVLTSGNFGPANASLWSDNTCYYSNYMTYGAGKIQSNRFVFKPGSVGAIKFTGNNFYDTSVAFKVTAASVANIEVEDNNTPATATPIKLKKTYSGTVNNNNDVDWFVFKAPKTGNYKIIATNTLAGGSSLLYVNGYKNKNKADIKCNRMLHVGAGSYTSKKIRLKKGKKYYIRMSDSLLRFGTTYELKVKKCK